MTAKTVGGQISPQGTIMGATINGGAAAPLLGATLVQGLPQCIDANQPYTVTLAAQGTGRVLKLSGDVTFTGPSALAECNPNQQGGQPDCVHTNGCTKTGVAGGIGFAAFQGAARQVQFTAASTSPVLVSVAYTAGSFGSPATWTAQLEVPACANQAPPPQNPIPIPAPVPIPAPQPQPREPPRIGGPTYELDLLLTLTGATFQDGPAIKAAMSSQFLIPPFYIDQPSYNKATLFLIDLQEAQAMQQTIQASLTRPGPQRNARSPLELAIRQQIQQIDGRTVDVEVQIDVTATQVNTGIPACSSFWYANEVMGSPAGIPISVEAFVAGNRVHVKATGPADRWFAIGLGQGMNNVDAWDVDGAGDEITDLRLRIQGTTPQVIEDNIQNVEQEMISDIDGVRTFDFWRDRKTNDGTDREFSCQGIQAMVYAMGATPNAITRAYHATNKGNANVNYDYLNSGVGPPPTNAPTTVPTPVPTANPTSIPTVTPEPTSNPTALPTPPPVARPAANPGNLPYQTTVSLTMRGVTSADMGPILGAFAQEIAVDSLYIDASTFNRFVVYSPTQTEAGVIEDRVSTADFSTAFSNALGKGVDVTAQASSTSIPATGCTTMRSISGILASAGANGVGAIEFDYFQAGNAFHMKVRGPQNTWFSAGIAGPGNVMALADVWIYQSTVDEFADYYLTDYAAAGILKDVDQSPRGQDSLKQKMLNAVDGVVEFSFWRDLDTGDAADQPIGCNDPIPMIWAASASVNTPDLGYHNTRRGVSAVTPTAVTSVLQAPAGGGTVLAPTPIEDDTQRRQIHGLLMILSWMILIPTGMLTAALRHILCTEGKMCFNACGDKHDGKKANWFLLHRFVNSFGVLLTFVGVALAYQFAQTPIPDSLHAQIGYGIVAGSLVQVLGGVFRPAKDAPSRTTFEWGHRIVGMGTFGAAAYQIWGAVAAYGVILEEYLGGQPLEQVQQIVMIWSGIVLGLMTLEIVRRLASGDSSGVVMEQNRVATVV